MSKWNVGAYIRLSRDDNYSESMSIINQKSMIDFVIKCEDGAELVDYYIDDGYSGTNFNRPEFKRMLDDIREKKVNMIVFKDLSRLGRNHIEVSNYIENIFSAMNIRVLSIIEHYDSLIDKDVMNNLCIPITNLVNDYIAHTISKNIKSTFNVRKKNGKHIASSVPYGYKKDPKDYNKFIIDEEAADVVRNIFNMFLLGKTKTEIANILNESNILTPSAYKKEKGLGNTTFKHNKWNSEKVNDILRKESYIGTSIQNVHGNENYRTHKEILRDEKEWIYNKNHHKAIISKKTFEKVQMMLNDKSRNKFNDSKDILSGYFKCFDCNSPMYLKKGKNKEYYYCKNYFRKKYCSNHSIEKEKLYEEVLNQINIKKLDDKPIKKITRNVICNYVHDVYIYENKTVNVIMKYEKEIIK